jgi:hypothetical protein
MNICRRFMLVVVLLGIGAATPTPAAELKVLVGGAYDQVFQAIVPSFEKQTGNTVKSEKGPAGTLKKRVESGEAFDVAIITPAVMEGLIKDGRLDAKSFASVGMVGVGVGVKEGAPKPDISSVEALKRALIAAKGVAYTDPATGATSGTYIDKLLVRSIPGGAMDVRAANADVGEFAVAQARQLVQALIVALPLPDEADDCSKHDIPLSLSSAEADDSLGRNIGIFAWRKSNNVAPHLCKTCIS